MKYSRHPKLDTTASPVLITPCTRESGCLQVIDGSHQWGLSGEVRALTESSVADALGDRAAGLADRIVHLELEPGNPTLHHCLTLHRSDPNKSAQTRKTLITRLFDAACTLLPERLPPGAAAHFPHGPDGRLRETPSPCSFPLEARRPGTACAARAVVLTR